MSIKLTWENINSADRTLKVYRAVGPDISIPTKGEAVATLSGNAVTWTDTDTVLGQDYSYLIETSFGQDVVYSRPTSTLDLFKRGPGSFTISQGDARLGYMGTVDMYQLPNVVNEYALPQYNSQYQFNQVWHKFIRKNRIIYVLNSLISNSSAAGASILNGSWVALNPGAASGIEFSFDTSGAQWANLRKTKIVESDGFRYHLRAARAFPDDWNGNYANLDLTLQADTEFNELIQPVLPGLTIPNQIGSWGAVSNSIIMRDFIAAESLNGASPLSLVKSIAQRSNNVVTEWGTRCASVNYQWNAYKEVSGASNAFAGIIPILELIQE